MVLCLQSFVMKCIGEGPVVHISPSSLNWGPIEVLTPNTKTVTISNESLIPADFITQMVSLLFCDPSLTPILHIEIC